MLETCKVPACAVVTTVSLLVSDEVDCTVVPSNDVVTAKLSLVPASKFFSPIMETDNDLYGRSLSVVMYKSLADVVQVEYVIRSPVKRQVGEEGKLPNCFKGKSILRIEPAPRRVDGVKVNMYSDDAFAFVGKIDMSREEISDIV